MSNFSASIPVAQMAAANAALELQGHGPKNFTVPAYSAINPGFALLHSWGDPVFEAHVSAIAGVVIQQAIVTPVTGQPDSVNNDPTAMTAKVAKTVGATWGSDAKPLTGSVTPGLYKDTAGALWWVIQAYNTTTYPDPTVIPALIRRAKVPGEILPWIQPIDQYDAYKLVNPFTGTGDKCTDGGFTWKVTQADGSGNNVYKPGVYGWTKV